LASLDFKALISLLEYVIRMKEFGKYKYLFKMGSFERYILINQQPSQSSSCKIFIEKTLSYFIRALAKLKLAGISL